MNLLMWLGRTLARIQSGLTLLVLGLVWVMSLGAAALLGGPGALAGVAVASIASLAAGFIGALRLPDWMPQQSARLTRELANLRRQVEASAHQQTELSAEIARLSGRRIRVEHYAPILGLNLVALNGQLRELDRRHLAPQHRIREQYFGLKQVAECREVELLNVLQVRFKAQLGVDLQALRFHAQAGQQVRVTGFRSQFQGVQEVQSTRELCTVLERVCQMDDPGDGEGPRPGAESSRSYTHDGQEAMQRALELQAQLIAQITRGLDLPHLDEAIQRMTMAFLQVIFAPLGLQLVFDPRANEAEAAAGAPADHALDASAAAAAGLPLTQFLERHNRVIDDRIQQLESTLAGHRDQARRLLGQDD